MKYWVGETKFWKKLAFMKDVDKKCVATNVMIETQLVPVSWSVCAMEINNHTKVGKRMFRILKMKGLL